MLKPKRSLKNFLLNIKAREKDEEDEKKIKENTMNAADLKKAEDKVKVSFDPKILTVAYHNLFILQLIKLKKAKKLEQKSFQLQERVKVS